MRAGRRWNSRSWIFKSVAQSSTRPDMAWHALTRPGKNGFSLPALNIAELRPPVWSSPTRTHPTRPSNICHPPLHTETCRFGAAVFDQKMEWSSPDPSTPRSKSFDLGPPMAPPPHHMSGHLSHPILDGLAARKARWAGSIGGPRSRESATERLQSCRDRPSQAVLPKELRSRFAATTIHN